MIRPRAFIVTPALASANNGNWHTASRWQQFLSERAETHVALAWNGEPADALIALHARRSADSIARFAAARPDRPLALVLTGTDLDRDLAAGDAGALRSLECATHVVVLQDEALQRLAPAVRAKARAIVQSAARRVAPRRAGGGAACFAAVGHLREEKDPATLMAAVRRLPADAAVRVLHVGAALDAALGEAARRTMADCPCYRWVGARPPGA
ncbi:MAG TPA: TIGR04348 family glycosyltransferase, partial [Albitalea sp.]